MQTKSIPYYPNVKEQINEYGEKVIRVDGDIPVDLPTIENKQRFLFISCLVARV